MVDQTSVAEGALAAENLTIAVGISLADSASASSLFTFKLYPGGLISESVEATDSVTLGAKHGAAVVPESAKASDAWLIKRVLTQTVSANATEVWTLKRFTALAERVKAADAITIQTHFKVTAGDSAKASEGWSYAKAGSLSDTGHAHDSVSISFLGGAQVADSAHAADLITAKRIAHASINEVVIAHDTLTPIGHYKITVLEPVTALETYITGGTNTAWAINTRTQAVTEYQGFSYNSFAQMGRKYLAADENGIYELDGPSDDGVKVAASMTGGYFQGNSGKFSGLKGVYLGVNGQGQGSTPAWLLTLDTGDGRELVYQTQSNPNLTTTKFRIGKGLKTHYLGWRVDTVDGQDFDFDYIEFIPSMSGRRV